MSLLFSVFSKTFVVEDYFTINIQHGNMEIWMGRIDLNDNSVFAAFSLQ